ncbi:hypothetical protein [Goodfellowiella coeruleoviolacea]|uniref:hypothetical protein n=1 Tax=Goodfellowiella coeruleoviolacea TaxID=334858 RepID=UPI0020A48D39|nr:hypothetical protein [Goodfellowiella coeruleoviolacea]
MLLGVATLVFDAGLGQFGAGLFPATAQDTHLGVLLFVKNPTTIALTFVLVVGIVRQLLSTETTPAVAEHPEQGAVATRRRGAQRSGSDVVRSGR